MKVVCIHLNSGEEIIARLEDDSKMLVGRGDQYEGPGPWAPTGKITIGTIRGITFQPVGKNQIGIAFVPWLAGNTDGQIMLNLDSSAQAIYPPTADIENGYLQQTSGIEIARPGMKM
jgi:hypothetical protein